MVKRTARRAHQEEHVADAAAVHGTHVKRFLQPEEQNAGVLQVIQIDMRNRNSVADRGRRLRFACDQFAHGRLAHVVGQQTKLLGPIHNSRVELAGALGGYIELRWLDPQGVSQQLHSTPSSRFGIAFSNDDGPSSIVAGQTAAPQRSVPNQAARHWPNQPIHARDREFEFFDMMVRHFQLDRIGTFFISITWVICRLALRSRVSLPCRRL